MTSTDGVTWTVKLHPASSSLTTPDYDAACCQVQLGPPRQPVQPVVTVGERHQHVVRRDRPPGRCGWCSSSRTTSYPGLLARALGYIAFSPKALTEVVVRDSCPTPSAPVRFMLKDWTWDSQMVLVRNPTYWNRPLPYVDQLVIRTILDEDQRMNSFINGEGNPLTLIRASSRPLTACARVRSTRPRWCSTVATTWCSTPPSRRSTTFFASPQGICAVARHDEVQQGLSSAGLNPPVDTLFRSDSPFYDASLKLPASDPVQAQKLLGRRRCGEGRSDQDHARGRSRPPRTGRRPSGSKPTLHRSRTSRSASTSPTAQRQSTRVLSKNYEAHLWGLQFDDPDPVMPSFFLSANQSSNVTGYSDTAVDAALNAGRNTFDPAKRVAAYKDVQRILATSVPTSGLYQRPFVLTFGAQEPPQPAALRGRGALHRPDLDRAQVAPQLEGEGCPRSWLSRSGR